VCAVLLNWIVDVVDDGSDDGALLVVFDFYDFELKAEIERSRSQFFLGTCSL
jgi:hypothetical protein